jgi:hypothetical protein
MEEGSGREGDGRRVVNPAKMIISLKSIRKNVRRLGSSTACASGSDPSKGDKVGRDKDGRKESDTQSTQGEEERVLCFIIGFHHPF